MRVAVTYENGEIFQHFGHTAQFKFYDIENGEITSTEVVDTNGSRYVKCNESRCADLRRNWRRRSDGIGRGRNQAVWRRFR